MPKHSHTVFVAVSDAACLALSIVSLSNFNCFRNLDANAYHKRANKSQGLLRSHATYFDLVDELHDPHDLQCPNCSCYADVSTAEVIRNSILVQDHLEG